MVTAPVPAWVSEPTAVGVFAKVTVLAVVELNVTSSAAVGTAVAGVQLFFVPQPFWPTEVPFTQVMAAACAAGVANRAASAAVRVPELTIRKARGHFMRIIIFT